MKVVTLITRMIRGGAQRIALETAAWLAANGIEAPLWCGPETGAEGSLHEEAAARGVPIRIFPDLVRRVDPVRDLRALASLTGALRAEAPDWVHTHSSKAGILGREAARRSGVPRVAHTVHGWGFTPATPLPVRALYAALERREARGCSALLFVSPGDRAEGERLGILRAGTGIVIPPGIDLAPYDEARLAEQRRATRARLGWPEDALVGGFLGRLAPQKDPATALAAAALLADTHPALRWIVVGDGPLGGRLRASAAADPRLRERIFWAGLQGDPVPWLAAMDFLLLSSLWEGTPLTVMEAMAAALPVIASDLPGVRFVLGGTLVPPGDAPAFARAVAALLQAPAARRAQGAESRRIALERFGMDRMLASVLRVYQGGNGGQEPLRELSGRAPTSSPRG